MFIILSTQGPWDLSFRLEFGQIINVSNIINRFLHRAFHSIICVYRADILNYKLPPDTNVLSIYLSISEKPHCFRSLEIRPT